MDNRAPAGRSTTSWTRRAATASPGKRPPGRSPATRHTRVPVGQGPAGLTRQLRAGGSDHKRRMSSTCVEGPHAVVMGHRGGGPTARPLAGFARGTAASDTSLSWVHAAATAAQPRAADLTASRPAARDAVLQGRSTSLPEPADLTSVGPRPSAEEIRLRWARCQPLARPSGDWRMVATGKLPVARARWLGVCPVPGDFQDQCLVC